MGIASLVSASYLFVVMPWPDDSGQPSSFRAVLTQHGKYARWSTSSELIHWLVSSLPVIALPFWFGFEASATFRVLNLFYMPLYQVVFACMVSLIPHFARATERAEFMRITRSSSLLWVGLASGYGVVLTFSASPISAFLYGSRYHISLVWLVLLMISGIFYTLANVHFAALRASQRPDYVFRASLVLCGILLGFVPLYPIFGMTAAVSSLAVGWGGVCIVTTLLTARVARSVTACPISVGSSMGVRDGTLGACRAATEALMIKVKG
jgi:O-antigen/teichoic acid export membrane protein